MFKIISILLWCLLALCTTAQNIREALETVAELSELNTLLSQSVDLASWLNRQKNITLLAPTNDAFKALLDSTPNDTHDGLLAYHVLDGVHETFDADGILMISTARQSSDLQANITGGQVVLARPQSLSNRTEFTSGLGQWVLTTGAAAITFDSGVIHILDGYLTTPGSFSSSAQSEAAVAFSEAKYANPTGGSNISGLDGLSNITVFLPIDFVWERIGNLVNGWTRSELDRVLSYHVINGVLEPEERSSQPAAGKHASFEGTQITISVVDDETFINNAKIVGSAPKIFQGGIIYTTYGVLNPDNTTIVGDQPNTSDVAFEGAIMTANFSFPSAERESSNATTTSDDDSRSESGGLSTGAKAAIGVGVPAAVFITGLAVAYWIIRRKRRAAIRRGNVESKIDQSLADQASASQRQLLTATGPRD